MSDPADSADAVDSGTEADPGSADGTDTDAGAATGTASDGEPADARYGVVLDVLPNGRPDDDRPQYQKSPVAYVLGESGFALYELVLEEDADVSVSDRVLLEPKDEGVATRYRETDYDDLTSNANAELEYAVEAIVDGDERRFVDFYNDATPITLRLHQLDLLPGIGDTLRNNVLDERKRGPFESFEEISDRISGLHRPREVVVERIMEELTEEDLKYRTFVGREE